MRLRPFLLSPLAFVFALHPATGAASQGSESRNIEFELPAGTEGNGGADAQEGSDSADTGNAELDAMLRAAARERCRATTRADTPARAACEAAAG